MANPTQRHGTWQHFSQGISANVEHVNVPEPELRKQLLIRTNAIRVEDCINYVSNLDRT